ncbi:MAG: rRNA maturation RNase YbeY [Anaerolineae bacterium]|nr:MAG: rRNA maturation RNase YbeY [Anaerolineae bacterium]
MVNLQLDTAIPQEIQQAIHQAVRVALRHQAQDDTLDLSIRVTDDAALQVLNRTYLGIDAPTDVLSFPSGEVDPESGRPYLGDIAISYPRACQQANAGGHAPLHEMQLLTVHGVLHLLGYDHATPEEKESMWQAQAQILEALGCPLSPP